MHKPFPQWTLQNQSTHEYLYIYKKRGELKATDPKSKQFHQMKLHLYGGKVQLTVHNIRLAKSSAHCANTTNATTHTCKAHTTGRSQHHLWASCLALQKSHNHTHRSKTFTSSFWNISLGWAITELIVYKVSNINLSLKEIINIMHSRREKSTKFLAIWFDWREKLRGTLLSTRTWVTKGITVSRPWQRY